MAGPRRQLASKIAVAIGSSSVGSAIERVGVSVCGIEVIVGVGTVPSLTSSGVSWSRSISLKCPAGIHPSTFSPRGPTIWTLNHSREDEMPLTTTISPSESSAMSSEPESGPESRVAWWTMTLKSPDNGVVRAVGVSTSCSDGLVSKVHAAAEENNKPIRTPLKTLGTPHRDSFSERSEH